MVRRHPKLYSVRQPSDLDASRDIGTPFRCVSPMPRFAERVTSVLSIKRGSMATQQFHIRQLIKRLWATHFNSEERYCGRYKAEECRDHLYRPA